MLPKALDEKKTSNDVCDVVVLTARIELAWLSPLPPQDSVSTNSTTSAKKRSLPRNLFFVGAITGTQLRHGLAAAIGITLIGYGGNFAAILFAVLLTGSRNRSARHF